MRSFFSRNYRRGPEDRGCGAAIMIFRSPVYTIGGYCDERRAALIGRIAVMIFAIISCSVIDYDHTAVTMSTLTLTLNRPSSKSASELC